MALLYKVVIVPAADVFLVSSFFVLVAVSNLILNENERVVIEAINENYKYTTAELSNLTSIKKDTLIRTLNSLIEKNVIKKDGRERATRYLKI